MINKIYLIVAVLVIVALAGGAYYLTHKPVGQIACTMEAKLCADGSSVGRTGPNCEFAACPSSSVAATPTGIGNITLRPKDADAPAAGTCVFENGKIVSVTIDPGIPSPRCVQVRTDQFLKIINNMDHEITAGFKDLPDIASQLRNIKIPIGGNFISTVNFGSYLDSGVHRLNTSEYGGSGPEIWLLKPEQWNGTIKGKVTVGPICPVERLDSPCPVPPEAYTSREVILYAADGITTVKRMNFTPDGTYQFIVSAGTYVLDIPRSGIGGSKDLSKTVTIQPGETSEVNFSIDTGIR